MHTSSVATRLRKHLASRKANCLIINTGQSIIFHTMTAEKLFEVVYAKAKDFGLVAKNEGRTIVEPKGNAIIRNNLLDISFNDGSA